MAARAAAIALALAALASAGRARAEDDPACAQYQEPMAYNACLARHGPKANNVGTQGHTQPDRAAQDRPQREETGHPATAGRGWQRAPRRHGRARMEFRVR
jgi:hypothetical protein